jgi:hypothetical protein
MRDGCTMKHDKAAEQGTFWREIHQLQRGLCDIGRVMRTSTQKFRQKNAEQGNTINSGGKGNNHKTYCTKIICSDWLVDK